MSGLPPSPSVVPFNRRQWVWGGVLLLAFVLVQGSYAVALNRLFYAQHGPFFDSLRYLGHLADLLDATKVDGFFSALRQSARMNATVFMPFGLVPFFGQWVGADRAVGVWLQCLWVLFCAGSLTGYLVRYRRAGLPLALALSVLFVSIHAVYFWSGGLSDFRVDLPFSLLFSTTMVWLLIALREQTRWTWAVFGLASALSCLSRATCPVFLVLTCLPMVAWDLIVGGPRRAATFKGGLLAAGLCILLSGWFYVLNWDQLHYYYFIWSWDANAGLPLSVSSIHLRYVADSVGPIVFVTAGLCSLFALAGRIARLRRQHVGAGRAFVQWLGEVEWRTLAPAVVPVGYLVLSGSGLNGLVSMPSAFGCVFLILSLAGHWPEGNGLARIITALALAGAGLSACTGVSMHFVGPGNSNPIGAYAEVSRAIHEQAGGFRQSDVIVGQFNLGNYNNFALGSYLTFDRHLPGRGGRLQLRDKTVVVTGSCVFTGPTKVEWEALPGNDDGERIAHIVETIVRDADLVVMPTQQSAEQFSARGTGAYINRFTARIRQRLMEKGNWGQVSNYFHTGDGEEYCVMRNNLH